MNAEEQDESATTASDVFIPMEPGTETSPTDEPTLHELQRKADIRGWEELRKNILSAFTESNAMPRNQLCIVCLHTAAEFRCQDCGPAVFYCHSCFCSKHENINLFHVAEKWQV